MTRYPRRTSASAACDPINPAAPVTRMFCWGELVILSLALPQVGVVANRRGSWRLPGVAQHLLAQGLRDTEVEGIEVVETGPNGGKHAASLRREQDAEGTDDWHTQRMDHTPCRPIIENEHTRLALEGQSNRFSFAQAKGGRENLGRNGLRQRGGNDPRRQRRHRGRHLSTNRG